MIDPGKRAILQSDRHPRVLQALVGQTARTRVLAEEMDERAALVSDSLTKLRKYGFVESVADGGPGTYYAVTDEGRELAETLAELGEVNV